MTSENQKTDHDDTFDNPFKEESGVTDLALIVEGKKIFVNKGLLCIVSPVFKAMFESGFKEKHCSEVELPGKSFEDVVDFMKLIYPNMDKPLDFQTVIRLLPLANEYGCAYHMEKCTRFLVTNIKPDENDVDIDTLLQCMLVSDMCGLQDVLNNCFKQGARHSSSVLTENKFFNKISPPIREKLYYNRMVMLENCGKDLVKEIIGKCGSCKQRMELKQLGLLLDTPIEIEARNSQIPFDMVETTTNFIFKRKTRTTLTEDIEIKKQ